jgi:RHS repeat-associated protein
MREGDMNTPFLYNGQAGVQTDSNGLLNMRARYYSPYLMRFLNADPIGFSGGSNWFAYADGNPISLSDPFGLCAGTLHDGTQVNADGSWKMNSHNIGVFFSSLGNTVTSGEVWERNLKNAASDPANWMSGFGMGGVANAMRNSVDNVAAAAAKAPLTKVTSWADEGITPDLNPGRWVQLGDATKTNFWRTGLPGPKVHISLKPPSVSVQGSKVPFTNSITDDIPTSSLQWPPGLDRWRGLFGQRKIIGGGE